MSARYVVNQPVILTCSFTVGLVLTDPSTVSLVVTDPTGTATTYTYSASITKSSTGVYTKTVTASTVGVWSYVWTSTGTAADVQDGNFTVYDDVPLNTNYCTLDELKGEKGISDATDDSVLSLSISAASRQIERVCGQRFWQDSAVQTRTYRATNRDYLDLLEVDDAAGISTTTGLIVKLDTDDTGTYETTLTNGTDFYLDPLNAATRNPVWPYTAVRMSGLNYWFQPSAYGRALVSITAKFGWPAIPDDVKKACLIQASLLGQSNKAALGIAPLATFEGAGMRAVALHPIAVGLLQPYMRPAVG
jgi:hypothetical protein